MQKNIKWSQLLGWAIFALVLAGGPLLNLFQSVTGIVLPSFTLPALIALLMLASAGASMLRAMSGSRSGTSMPGSSEGSNNYPMPSFGEGGARMPRFGRVPSQMPPPTAMPPTETPRLPEMPLTQAGLPRDARTPKMEPVISPMVILLGVIGIVVLISAAAILFVAP